MNDDFEQELHELLQERGATPMQSPQAPPKVLRRARRRQLSTALVSGATAVAVIGGAILGAQALRGNGGGQPVAEDSHADSRTVVFNGYTVTYPYDWALQSASGGFFAYPVGPEQPVEGDGTAGNDVAETAKPQFAAAGPSLQLSNLYPDHLLDLTCAGTDVGPAGVAVQVTPLIDPAAGDSSGGLEKKKTCDDGSTLYAQSVRSGHLAFSAAAKAGPGATDADVQALFDAYDSIGYPSGDTGVVGGRRPGSPLARGSRFPTRAARRTTPRPRFRLRFPSTR